MNQLLSGLVVAAVLSGLWLLGRPRRTLLPSTDTSAVAALNRAQIVLVAPTKVLPELAPPVTPDPPWSGPASPQDRLRLERQLKSWWSSGPEGRRRVINVCGAWGHPSSLPWLRMGLRDSDGTVVALSAEAIARFRSRPQVSGSGAVAQGARLPRNVARTL